MITGPQIRKAWSPTGPCVPGSYSGCTPSTEALNPCRTHIERKYLRPFNPRKVFGKLVIHEILPASLPSRPLSTCFIVAGGEATADVAQQLVYSWNIQRIGNISTCFDPVDGESKQLNYECLCQCDLKNNSSAATSGPHKSLWPQTYNCRQHSRCYLHPLN